LFFSYTVSVALLALAIYGLWNVGRDCLEWLAQSRRSGLPSISIVLYVRDAEYVIEDLLYCIFHELDKDANYIDLLLVDGGSQDLTLAIMERMTAEREEVRLIALAESYRYVHDVLPLCRGGSIHLFDLANRLTPGECLSSVHYLLATHRHTHFLQGLE
jgi:16S rRNA U1498 N3-methylase RsmE